MYGYPADVEAMRAIAGDERILIIEDSALLGPLSSGSGEVGLRGDIAVFSFGPSKHLYTIQGGVVVTNSADLYRKIKDYRDREMNRLSWKVWTKRFARFMNGYMMLNATLLEVMDRLHHIGSMQNVRNRLGLAKGEIPGDYATAFADFQGYIGLAQLRKFDSILAKHRAWAEFYDRELQDVPGISPAPIIEGATYGSYTVRVERRDEIDFRRQMRAKDINVEEETRFDYVLPRIESYRPYADGPYPHAEQAAREVVNLPNYAGLSAASARHIVESIKRSLASPAFY